MALNVKNRLKKKRDFENVFKKGKAVNGSFLFIKHRTNELGIPRFGFVISAKIAKKSVERNKIRRIISETARSRIKNLEGHDIIVFATKKTIIVDKKDLIDDFLEVLKKIK